MTGVSSIPQEDLRHILGADGSLQSPGESHQTLLSCSRILGTSAAPLFHTGVENTGSASQSPSPPPSQDFTRPAVDVPVALVTALHRGETERPWMGHTRLPCPTKTTPLTPPPSLLSPRPAFWAMGRCVLMHKEAEFPPRCFWGPTWHYSQWSRC